MVLLTLFFFLCISEYTILLVSSEQEVIIPTELIQNELRPAIRAYAMYLFVGTPPRPMTIEITFKHNLMIFYTDLSHISDSYYITDHQIADKRSEIVYFGSKPFRIPVIYDPRRNLFGEHSHCITCDGMIGLGKGSFFLSLWPDISFTSSSIIAGDVNFLMKSSISSACKGCIIHCNDPLGIDKSLCVTQGILSNDGKTYPIKISIDSPIVYLPQKLYDTYTTEKNIYKDRVSEWEVLKISIPSVADSSMDPNSKSNIIGKGIDLSKCHLKNMEIIIDPNYLLHSFEMEGKVFLLKPNSNPQDENITLGNSVIFNQVIMYKNADGNYLFIQNHTVHDNISVLSLLIFAALFWYLIRWKMTDLSFKITETEKKEKKSSIFRRNNRLNLFYEITAPLLAITALLIPNVRNILSDFPVLYIISIVIFVIACIVEFGVIIFELLVIEKKVEPEKKLESEYKIELVLEHKELTITKKELYQIFLLNFLRNLSHETILMIGLWVIVVERRTEGISSVLTVIANVYILYNITFFLLFFLIYTGYVKQSNIRFKKKQQTKKKQRGYTIDDIEGLPFLLWSLTLIGLILLIGFQIFATYNYFTSSLFMRNAQVYRELIIPTLIVIFIFIIDIAFFMVSLYINSAIKLILKKYISDEERSNEQKLVQSLNSQNTFDRHFNIKKHNI